MPTLQELKKQVNHTNVSIGRALGISASVAGMVLQGRHIHVYHDEEIQRLADILGVTFERCWYAMQESYVQSMNRPAPEQRADEVRRDAQMELIEQMPDVRITVGEPRQMATTDSYLIVPALQIDNP